MRPSVRSLVLAHRTLERLSREIGPGKVFDVGGMDMWGSLVEGRRAIAVTTAYLAGTAEDDVLGDRYDEAWERMVKGDES